VREYNPDTKAAVLAALLQGQSVNSVAKTYKVPRSTIQGWRDAAGMNDSALPRSKKDEIGEKILAYLDENLTTLRAQAEFFRDKEWLKKQDASSLAVLHGVITDKAIRLLEALAGEEGETEEYPAVH